MISRTDPSDLKLEHSFDELIARIDDEDLSNHVVNIHRKNYCIGI